MREIKFRIWHEKTNNMFMPYSFNFYGDNNTISLISYNKIKNIYLELEDREEHITVLAEDCILMQYIGLKDINGKEIYEWDILSNDCYKCIVEYDVLFCRYVLNKNGRRFEIISNNTIKDMKIIGNICENLEYKG